MTGSARTMRVALPTMSTARFPIAYTARSDGCAGTSIRSMTSIWSPGIEVIRSTTTLPSTMTCRLLRRVVRSPAATSRPMVCGPFPTSTAPGIRPAPGAAPDGVAPDESTCIDTIARPSQVSHRPTTLTSRKIPR